MTIKNPHLMLPLAAVALSMLTGCSSMGSLMGQSQPQLSPAAKAAAEMPLEKEVAVNTQETYLSLVKQMQAKSLWYASIAHLDALDKQWGASSDSRLMRADALRQVGQLNAAALIYQSLLSTAKDGAARYGLGRVAAQNGDFRYAAQQMEQARMSNPVDSQLLTDLGYVHLRARDLNAARIPLMQAAQLNPEDAQANVNLSLFMMVSGQAAQAEEFMRDRKLDAQTRQAVKEQAGEWLQGAKQAAQALPDPATKATGKVVNLSRQEVVQPAATVAKTAEPVVAPEAAKVQEVPAAKKSLPEPEVAQTPVIVSAPPQVTPEITADAARASMPATAPAALVELPLPLANLAPPMQAQSAARAASGGQWMVSGGGFDSGRSSYPGRFMPATSQTYAYAVPAPASVYVPSQADLAASVVPVAKAVVAGPSTSVVAVSPEPLVVQQHLMTNQALAAVHQAPAAPLSVANKASVLAPTLAPAATPAAVQKLPELRQPTGPARSLQEGAVVMAVANVTSPAAARVRQASSINASQQVVQAMLPRRTAPEGLFFETPDVETSSQPAPSAKTTPPERVWP
ncbi:hypothetical protein KUF54_13945 [Comamonas sp. Y33R10-2]|uniref:tetratricopeptide repeat protein n=1 Tax=Comamonas sp. Y33R10-2 TaxID=2853257 RepID=UPI001C5C8417|nr:hypothetical protein [Comamonas sp. Y33R10-2]QXZ09115.1 hypothetical protein KUF54_13945 [Comamonas sp. Y33R10-2]